MGFVLFGYPLCLSEGHSKKTFRHRDTEDTEKFKKQSGTLCALCVSNERNERVVKRIIKPDNNYWSEVDNQIVLYVLTLSLIAIFPLSAAEQNEINPKNEEKLSER